jgi:hypothetical protein
MVVLILKIEDFSFFLSSLQAIQRKVLTTYTFASPNIKGVMFPPVDDAVLRNNPDFAILYNKLTNVALNPDGSSRTTSASRERAAVQKVHPPLTILLHS